MSHLPGQTLLLEDITVDTFAHSSFGTVVMTLFQGLFTAPSWHTFTSSSCGWALATDRHTISTYLCLTGAATVKHFSRFYVFLGCPLYHKRWQLWAPLSAWRRSLCPRARSFGSASTIRPRKRPAPISRDSPATAMAPAPPVKNTARCAA